MNHLLREQGEGTSSLRRFHLLVKLQFILRSQRFLFRISRVSHSLRRCRQAVGPMDVLPGARWGDCFADDWTYFFATLPFLRGCSERALTFIKSRRPDVLLHYYITASLLHSVPKSRCVSESNSVFFTYFRSFDIWFVSSFVWFGKKHSFLLLPATPIRIFYFYLIRIDFSLYDIFANHQPHYHT